MLNEIPQPLLQPCRLGDLLLPNRVVMAPLTRGRANLHEPTNRRRDEYDGSVENRARFLFDVLEAVLEVWPSERVGVKTGPMMNELGMFKAVESTLPTTQYVYEKLNAYNLSHVFLMRQLADLSGTLNCCACRRRGDSSLSKDLSRPADLERGY